MKEKSNIFERFFETFFEAIFHIAFFVLINIFYDDIPFFTEDFTLILPIYNISVLINIILLISRIFIRDKVYKSLTNIISNIIFLYIASKLWTIYPFDTSVIGNQNTWDIIFKGLIILPAIGVVLGTFAEVINLTKES